MSILSNFKRSIFKNRKHFLAILFMLATASIAVSQEPEWQNITPMGWSGDFMEMADAGNGKVIALSDSGCVYQSIDTGLTWTPLYKMRKGAPINHSSGHVYKLAFHPSKQYGAVICDSVLAYTTDNGLTWKPTRIADFGNFAPMNLYWKSEDTLLCVADYANAGPEVFMSTDHGYSWTKKSNLLWYGAVYHYRCFHFASKSHGFMFTETHDNWTVNTFAETTDGGNAIYLRTLP